MPRAQSHSHGANCLAGSMARTRVAFGIVVWLRTAIIRLGVFQPRLSRLMLELRGFADSSLSPPSPLLLATRKLVGNAEKGACCYYVGRTGRGARSEGSAGGFRPGPRVGQRKPRRAVLASFPQRTPPFPGASVSSPAQPASPSLRDNFEWDLLSVADGAGGRCGRRRAGWSGATGLGPSLSPPRRPRRVACFNKN